MKVHIQGYILYRTESWVDKDKRYTFLPFDASKNDASYLMVSEHVCVADVPDKFDPTTGLIKALQKQQTKIRADAEKEVTKIEERIQSLLAIEGPKQ